MLNQVILVGQVENEPSIIVLPDDKKKAVVDIRVQRNYKNVETNEYDSDLVSVHLWEGVAESTVKYVSVGSTIGVKARIVVEEGIISIQGEKVTFINTK